MTHNVQRLLLASTLGASLPATNAFATNGMSMEAYGARAGGMGGAAMAYDAGNSAVMSNPATLSLMADGQARVGVGLTILGPDVSATGPAAFGSPSTDSDGTEYGKATQGDLFFAGQTAFGATDPDGLGQGVALLSGREVRSEVGFGRLMAPLSFKVNNKLALAAQLDFVWATMDQMDIDGATFADMAFNTNPQLDVGSAEGSMVQAFGAAQQGGMIDDVSWARFDFSDDNDFSGEASGYGFAGKLGILYQVNPQLSVGATYHTVTQLDDLNTSDATIAFDGSGQAFGGGAIDIRGDIDVIDFQWPATLGLGAAFKLNPQWMFAGDIRHLFWSDVMDNFKMTFTADATQANPAAAGFANTRIDATILQEWDDQTVFSLGAQYKPNPKLALRAGINVANNPVPDQYLNALFPAIVKNHYTAGIGFAINANHQVGAAIAYAPEVKQTNSQNNVASTHSQTTWRMNYVYKF